MLALLAVPGVLLMLNWERQEPPEVTFKNTRVALDSAAAAGALRYAEESYREAEKTMKAGWMEMARQKGRLAFFRNYQVADSLLYRAAVIANQSASQARDKARDLETQALTQIAGLRTELTTWREALNGSLMNFKAENYWSTAEMGLQVSDRLIREKEFQAAMEAIADSKDSLRQLSKLLAEVTNDETRQLAHWRTWVQETLAESRATGGYAIIVNKAAHKAHLVRAGKLVRSYECEVGYNSARQKAFAGDGATPEGKYHVVHANNGSKYYRALMLDYPNASDRRRFQENKSRGIISRHARIGKNIEIHGGGGRNEDWTDGCVALTNEDMNSLMRSAAAGTPVTIVRRSDQWP
jgi:L,D-peptidoglycan transpeptidase YkuD (ErfK/YbiS/YcfS/YnhG family)